MTPQLAGQFLAVVLVSFVHAIIVRWGVRLLAKVQVRYWKAFGLALSANVVSFVVGLISSGSPQGIGSALVIGFFVGAAIYAFGIRTEDREPIGLGNGMAIQLLVIAVFVVPVLLLVLGFG